jgi:hypothetical protein
LARSREGCSAPSSPGVEPPLRDESTAARDEPRSISGGAVGRFGSTQLRGRPARARLPLSRSRSRLPRPSGARRAAERSTRFVESDQPPTKMRAKGHAPLRLPVRRLRRPARARLIRLRRPPPPVRRRPRRPPPRAPAEPALPATAGPRRRPRPAPRPSGPRRGQERELVRELVRAASRVPAEGARHSATGAGRAGRRRRRRPRGPPGGRTTSSARARPTGLAGRPGRLRPRPPPSSQAADRGA